MEKLKDLDIMISEATRMYNVVKVFEELPRMLEILQSSNALLGEMKAARDKAEIKKNSLIEEVAMLEDALDKMDEKIKSKEGELSSLSETIKTQKATLIDEMEVEVDTLRSKREKELEKQDREIKLVMHQNEQAMMDNKQEMERARAISEAEIEKYRNAEREARQRAEKALADFEKIKKSLLGGK